jgi:hypothetical protein
MPESNEYPVHTEAKKHHRIGWITIALVFGVFGFWAAFV